MMEQTLVIIKPDAVKRGLIGEILLRFEKAGLQLLGMKMVLLTKEDTQKFYAEHRGKPFFEELVGMMSSSPVVVVVLVGDNAINRVREIMGATRPAEADPGTIRHDFALNETENSVHGADCPKSATREVSFFFNMLELSHHIDT
jgi:nucleoside-diphosphate kinase